MKDKKTTIPEHHIFFDRDLSWLSFNERVLDEAQRPDVPLMERIRFLGIYSSNLDEFYRVRMPALMALGQLNIGKNAKTSTELLKKINNKVLLQQKHFGSIIENQILSALKQQNIHLLYKEAIPEQIMEPLRHYFIHTVAAYLKVIPISDQTEFFPENNKLYNLVALEYKKHQQQFYIVNIPSDVLPRFYTISSSGIQYIIFLEDILKLSLPQLFLHRKIAGSHNFKTTRDAEIDLQDEFSGNLARKIEKKISQRDLGAPTRFLYEPGITDKTLKMLRKKLNLKNAGFIPGGTYHNLKDLSSFPLKDPQFSYEPWPRLLYDLAPGKSLFENIQANDILLHTPYHKYDTVLRFFNEASIDASVEKIYVTLYRIAQDSIIAEALISAARNGKKVVVFVELKARFDEANNIKWSKRMKAAGVEIIESIPGLKVHAKLALVKRHGLKNPSLGLIATGNFNESTARYYTDHLLMTANPDLLKEAEKLFLFLTKRKKQPLKNDTTFRHLLVGQFNLQQKFLELIAREIGHAEKGLPAAITIKLNNLEDRVLISKLYEASQKGVQVRLMVRSICCLVPGVKGMSENISVKRIVDRYLEHGRSFIFHNNGNEEVFIGSADWMNRNIYRRIEVCCPIQDLALKKELRDMIDLQFSDNHQAVVIDHECCNIRVSTDTASPIRSQKLIGEVLNHTLPVPV